MNGKRFRRFYNRLIENKTNKKYDIQDCCNLLNELSNENGQLKQQLRNSVELFRKDSVTLFELKEENKELKVNYKELRYANNIYCNKIDSLKKENEQLKKEKEFWKSDACSLSSLNSILSNELSIAQEQGYEPSTSYKEYITSIKTEYDKFWENKIKTHNNRLKELQRND